MLKKCSFNEKENKLDYYRGKDCIEKLCIKIKERVMKIINYKIRDIKTLTQEENNMLYMQRKVLCR